MSSAGVEDDARNLLNNEDTFGDPKGEDQHSLAPRALSPQEAAGKSTARPAAETTLSSSTASDKDVLSRPPDKSPLMRPPLQGGDETVLPAFGESVTTIPARLPTATEEDFPAQEDHYKTVPSTVGESVSSSQSSESVPLTTTSSVLVPPTSSTFPSGMMDATREEDHTSSPRSPENSRSLPHSRYNPRQPALSSEDSHEEGVSSEEDEDVVPVAVVQEQSQTGVPPVLSSSGVIAGGRVAGEDQEGAASRPPATTGEAGAASNEVVSTGVTGEQEEAAPEEVPTLLELARRRGRRGPRPRQFFDFRAAREVLDRATEEERQEFRTAAHKMYSNLMTIPPRARSPVFRGNPRRTVRMNALEAAMIARDLNLEGPDLSDPQYRRWLAEQEANEERDVQLEIELEFGPQQPLAADLSDLETASSLCSHSGRSGNSGPFSESGVEWSGGSRRGSGVAADRAADGTRVVAGIPIPTLAGDLILRGVSEEAGASEWSHSTGVGQQELEQERRPDGDPPPSTEVGAIGPREEVLLSHISSVDGALDEVDGATREPDEDPPQEHTSPYISNGAHTSAPPATRTDLLLRPQAGGAPGAVPPGDEDRACPPDRPSLGCAPDRGPSLSSEGGAAPGPSRSDDTPAPPRPFLDTTSPPVRETSRSTLSSIPSSRLSAIRADPRLSAGPEELHLLLPGRDSSTSCDGEAPAELMKRDPRLSFGPDELHLLLRAEGREVEGRGGGRTRGRVSLEDECTELRPRDPRASVSDLHGDRQRGAFGMSTVSSGASLPAVWEIEERPPHTPRKNETANDYSRIPGAEPEDGNLSEGGLKRCDSAPLQPRRRATLPSINVGGGFFYAVGSRHSRRVRRHSYSASPFFGSSGGPTGTGVGAPASAVPSGTGTRTFAFYNEQERRDRERADHAERSRVVRERSDHPAQRERAGREYVRRVQPMVAFEAVSPTVAFEERPVTVGGTDSRIIGGIDEYYDPTWDDSDRNTSETESTMIPEPPGSCPRGYWST